MLCVCVRWKGERREGGGEAGGDGRVFRATAFTVRGAYNAHYVYRSSLQVPVVCLSVPVCGVFEQKQRESSSRAAFFFVVHVFYI